MDIKLIIFDLDGTLIDSKVDIANGVNFTLRELNLKEVPDDLIYTYVGNGVEPLIRKSLEAAGGNGIGNALDIFRAYYLEHLLDNTVLYPNVIGVIEKLSGIKKAVVSNKSERFVKKILSGLDIAKYFEIALGGDSLKKTLIVGDSAVDIECGKRAGTYTCGVTYGYRDKKELIEAGADWIIDDMGELANLILNADSPRA